MFVRNEVKFIVHHTLGEKVKSCQNQLSSISAIQNAWNNLLRDANLGLGIQKHSNLTEIN